MSGYDGVGISSSAAKSSASRSFVLDLSFQPSMSDWPTNRASVVPWQDVVADLMGHGKPLSAFGPNVF